MQRIWFCHLVRSCFCHFPSDICFSALPIDATRAVSELHGKDLRGSKLKLDFARQKKDDGSEEPKVKKGEGETVESKPRKAKVAKPKTVEGEQKPTTKLEGEARKEAKKKRGRIIVRNLSFQVPCGIVDIARLLIGRRR